MTSPCRCRRDRPTRRRSRCRPLGPRALRRPTGCRRRYDPAGGTTGRCLATRPA
ncbi:MAG: hypothetical protein MZV64_42650 [Ignavibacteriales bacterium]|nr:hypothetical protein [Ignavibacteriales bacterium]